MSDDATSSEAFDRWYADLAVSRVKDDVVARHLAHGLDGLDDHGELSGHAVELLVGHVDVGETREVRDVVPVDLSHGSPLEVGGGFLRPV